MSRTKKQFDELDIIDDFLMNAVATDPEVGEAFCRKTLSVLLQKKIGKIRVVAQRSVPAVTPLHRGIRMDVEVEEFSEDDDSSLNIYDIEPHKKDAQSLPKHNRFYQAKIDSRYMVNGERNFDKLPNLYIITITNYDPFGADYMMYTLQNSCVEVPELSYEDGLRFIYFNTKGTKGGNEAIRNLLSYIQDSKESSVTDDNTRELHEYVKKVRVQPEVRMEYMKFDDIIAYERRDQIRDCIMELLEDYGEIPQLIHERLESTWSKEILTKWHKLAAQVNSIEEFIEKM